MKRAILIRTLEGWRGDARLYFLSEPLEGNYYVVVSAVDFSSDKWQERFSEFADTKAMLQSMLYMLPPETYIFGCDQNGENVDLAELNGSYRGGTSHAQALHNAGYTIEEN